jgi:hypothetical protein
MRLPLPSRTSMRSTNPATLFFQIIVAVPDFDTVTLPGPGLDEVSATITDLLVCGGH